MNKALLTLSLFGTLLLGEAPSASAHSDGLAGHRTGPRRRQHRAVRSLDLATHEASLSPRCAGRVARPVRAARDELRRATGSDLGTSRRWIEAALRSARGHCSPWVTVELRHALDYVTLGADFDDGRASLPPQIEARAFALVMQTVEREISDHSRHRLALELLAHQGLRADQLADLLRLFSFDSTRKDVVVSLADQVLDPENAVVAVSAMRWDTTRREALAALNAAAERARL